MRIIRLDRCHAPVAKELLLVNVTRSELVDLYTTVYWRHVKWHRGIPWVLSTFEILNPSENQSEGEAWWHQLIERGMNFCRQ